MSWYSDIISDYIIGPRHPCDYLQLDVESIIIENDYVDRNRQDVFLKAISKSKKYNLYHSDVLRIKVEILRQFDEQLYQRKDKEQAKLLVDLLLNECFAFHNKLVKDYQQIQKEQQLLKERTPYRTNLAILMELINLNLLIPYRCYRIHNEYLSEEYTQVIRGMVVRKLANTKELLGQRSSSDNLAKVTKQAPFPNQATSAVESENSILSFGYKGKLNMLSLIYENLNLDAGPFIDRTKTTFDEFFNILTAKDVLKQTGSIYLGCETTQASYILLKSLNCYFRALSPKAIANSNKFFSRKGTPLTYSNIVKSKNAPNGVKDVKEIDKFFSGLQNQ